MTMGSKPTEWYDQYSRPAEVGVYHRKSANDNCNDRAFWDGRKWFGISAKKGRKPKIADAPHPYQDRAWKPVPLRIAEEMRPGEKFNMLTYLENIGPDKSNRRWLGKFLCDCGNTKAMNIYEVRSGVNKSCGCLGASKDVAEKRSIAQKNWIDANRDLIAETNKKVGEKLKGRTRALGAAGKWGFNVNSKYFCIANKDGLVIEGWNLAELVRKHSELFDPEDVVWVENVCKALKGLYRLYETKASQVSWKGWRRLSDLDRDKVKEQVWSK